MFVMNNEFKKMLKEWSEGNEYLYSLLYLAWENGIRTAACCGGHVDHKDNDPYILFIVDENSLPFFKSMIGALEKIPDVMASISFRDNPNLPNDSRIVLSVHCMMHNRMEVFYRLAAAIIEKQKIETQKGEKFYQSLVNFLHADKKQIKKEMAAGVVVSSTFTTFTKEREEYLTEKKKVLNRLKRLLIKSQNKYDSNQESIVEEPQIRF